MPTSQEVEIPQTPDATVTVADSKKARRFDQRDFDTIAEYIQDIFATRKRKRKDKEKVWKEIDRQLRMEPITAHKVSPITGRTKPGMGWKPEIELPLSAQTLEILCADARRMIFPDNGPWFRAHAFMSDAYLNKISFKSLLAGSELDLPTPIDQDNCDKIVEGIMGDIHEQQGFFSQIDRFNAEAFKYGTAVGRVRKARKDVYIDTARGVSKEEQLLPVFFASSIKDTYLDDTPQFVLNEGFVIGPGTIFSKRQKLADLVVAAQRGSKSPLDEDGGWMPSKLKDLQADKDGCVDVIRWEGDLVVERKTVDNLFIPGALVTLVVSGGKPRVVKLAFREKPFSSYITQPYHVEDVNSPYGVSPLEKGMPLQKAATAMFGSLVESGFLNVEPPVQYDPDDPQFTSTGGPLIEPRALWGSSGEIKVHQIGDPGALLNAYATIVTHFADVTGMHAPRLGQQTVSHTTAYAKEAELSRGQVRTVDYANTLLDGAMSRILDMQFSYLADVWGKERDVWIPDYGGFVTVFKDVIPPACVFEIFGSAGPADQRASMQDKMGAIQQVIQIDQLKMQLAQAMGLPMPKPVDLEAFQKMILKGAGFADAEVLFTSAPPSPTGQPPVGPGVPGNASLNSGTASTALQALAFGGNRGT
ncbi:MAG TPA: hypothetical protein VIY48_07045 [Candidatus Paceibacterota bacterium]